MNDFKKLCLNLEMESAIACRVYMDLILDKKYDSVNKCYNSALNVFYLKAENNTKEKVVILPYLISQDLDFNIVQKLQGEECGTLCDTSSNVLYYRKFEE